MYVCEQYQFGFMVDGYVGIITLTKLFVILHAHKIGFLYSTILIMLMTFFSISKESVDIGTGV